MAAAEIEVLSVVSADGTRIGCEVVGAGPPLLLVHGSTADRSRWAASATRSRRGSRCTSWTGAAAG